MRMHAALASVSRRESSTHRLGIAWVALCTALAIHVTDEALTGFLSVYNPTVLALRAKLGFWPMPTFEFREWFTGLVFDIMLLAALSPLCISKCALDSTDFLFLCHRSRSA
jgi:hypothetical protein